MSLLDNSSACDMKYSMKQLPSRESCNGMEKAGCQEAVKYRGWLQSCSLTFHWKLFSDSLDVTKSIFFKPSPNTGKSEKHKEMRFSLSI